jgi:hypothetical protein
MAQLQISDLPSTSPLQSTDKFGIDDASRITWKVTSVDIFNYVAANLSITNFNAIAPTTTKGDLIVNNGSGNVREAVGTDNTVLIADSTQSTGIRWGTVPSPGDNIVVVTTTTTLTGAQLGSTIVVKNTANITINLPLSSSGTNQFFYFVFDCTTSTFVVVQPQPGDSIFGSGAGTYIFGKGEGVTLMTDGSGVWIPSSISLQPVTIQLARAGNQSISGITTILWDTVINKVNTTYNTSTGIFTFLYPGVYTISATLLNSVNGSAYGSNLTISAPNDSPSSSYVQSAIPASTQLTTSITASHSSTAIVGTDIFSIQFSNTVNLGILGSTLVNILTATRISNYG